jgi:hypothetical protein
METKMETETDTEADIETDTETQPLIEENGDINNNLAQEPPVLWAKDPLNLTANECRL